MNGGASERAFATRKTSSPLMSGSRMSQSTRSGPTSGISSTALLPVCHQTARQPSSCSARWSDSPMIGSSSTIAMHPSVIQHGSPPRRCRLFSPRANSWRNGHVMLMSVDKPLSWPIRISPPWSATRRRTIQSPKPLPTPCASSERPTRYLARSSCSPGPWSPTSIVSAAFGCERPQMDGSVSGRRGAGVDQEIEDDLPDTFNVDGHGALEVVDPGDPNALSRSFRLNQQPQIVDIDRSK